MGWRDFATSLQAKSRYISSVLHVYPRAPIVGFAVTYVRAGYNSNKTTVVYCPEPEVDPGLAWWFGAVAARN